MPYPVPCQTQLPHPAWHRTLAPSSKDPPASSSVGPANPSGVPSVPLSSYRPLRCSDQENPNQSEGRLSVAASVPATDPYCHRFLLFSSEDRACSSRDCLSPSWMCPLSY